MSPASWSYLHWVCLLLQMDIQSFHCKLVSTVRRRDTYMHFLTFKMEMTDASEWF